MRKEDFIYRVKNPGTLREDDFTEFSELIIQYPLFSLARIFEVIASSNTGSENFNKILRKNSSYIGSLKQLFLLMNRKHEASITFVPSASTKSEEKAVINRDVSFSTSEKMNDEVLLSFDYRQAEKPEVNENVESPRKAPPASLFPTNRKFELIDKFIENNPGSIRSDNSSVSGEIPVYEMKEDDNLITSTLAGIYVRQGLFSKAIYAYEKLILKYPEKSVYFASQIEEIKKLINK